MKFLLATLTIVLAFTASTMAQEIKEPRNSIYLSAGAWGLYGAVGANYERLVYQSDGFISQYYVRAGAGLWGAWAARGFYTHAGVLGLTGRRKGHFEMYLGVAPMYNEEIYVDNSQTIDIVETASIEYFGTFLAASLGYRYQKPGSHFLFRTGVSWPDGIYLSTGFRF